jgi:RND family efflux transporter MFP subunit
VSTVASEIAGLVVEFTGQEGRRVNEGEVLVRLKRDNLEVNLKAAEAQLKEDEARHQLARRNLERMRELYNSKDVSQKQLDDATFEFGAWEARLERLKAEIARISDDLKRSVITAPFRGVIVRKRTELGEWIVQGGTGRGTSEPG